MLKIKFDLVLTIVICSNLSVTAKHLLCLDGSTVTNDDICKCTNNEFYNAYEGKCQKVCSYYGDTICGGYNAKTKCSYDNENLNSLNYTCGCQSGYNVTFEVSCLDINECDSEEKVCSDVEVCVNLPGSFYCACNDNYFRNQDGVCTQKNMCEQPGAHVCSQICKTKSNEYGYKCSCFEGYQMDELSHLCELDEPTYNSCACGSNPEWTICAQKVNETPICEPKPGFQFKSENDQEVEDINECENNSHECGRGTLCKNSIGAYYCHCLKDYYLNQTYNECLKKECPIGTILYNHSCKALCGTEIGPECPSDTVCLIDDNNVASCECKLACQLNGLLNNISGLSVYAVTFDVSTESLIIPEGNLYPKFQFLVTKSMESIFGRGNAQIINFDDHVNKIIIEIAVGVSQPINYLNKLEKLISNFCWPLEGNSAAEKCVLPAGLIINTSSIQAKSLYPCETFPTLCSIENFICVDGSSNDNTIQPGNYQCKCDVGYEEVNEREGLYCRDVDECALNRGNCSEETICQNIPGSYTCLNYSNEKDILLFRVKEFQNEVDDLNTKLSDEQYKTKAIGGTLGALLGLSIILLLIGGVYCYKLKAINK